jgi:hypothetical protein
MDKQQAFSLSRSFQQLTCVLRVCLRAADGPADEMNVTLTITNTSAEFTKLGR